MSHRRPRRARGVGWATLGDLAGMAALLAAGVLSAYLLFLWQPPTGSPGAMLDLLVQFYRPVMWVVLGISTLVLVVLIARVLRRR